MRVIAPDARFERETSVGDSMVEGLRIDGHVCRPVPVLIHVDGEAISAYPGEGLAAALACAGRLALRRSPRAGAPRGAFRHMGICGECRVLVDGEPTLACLEAVREGASLAEALAATQEFPVFVSNMVAVGEESGTVDAALLKVSATYEREIDRTIRTLTTILEPVLLVIVGGVVLCIVLAMLLPIFQIGLEV